LMDCSFTWLVNGPLCSLAYALADNGYDVWLANNRGNTYSKRHLYLDHKSSDFWKFSYDEFAAFDLPDTISYILTTTNQTKLAYIGHSEGTTQAFASLSQQNEVVSNSLSCLVGLGPVATVGHITCPFFISMAKIRLDNLIQMVGFKKAFTLPFNSDSFRQCMAVFLWIFPWVGNDVIRLMCGVPEDGRSVQRSEMIGWAENEPSGSSVKNVAHWAQAVRSGQFRMYDFGPAANLKRYKHAKPPIYDLKKIPSSLPKALYVGTNDELADETDVSFLVSELGGKGVYLRKMENYNHTDYLWDPRAATELYPDVISFVQQHHPSVRSL